MIFFHRLNVKIVDGFFFVAGPWFWLLAYCEAEKVGCFWPILGAATAVVLLDSNILPIWQSKVVGGLIVGFFLVDVLKLLITLL
jgi:hypothetical protein